MIPTTPHHAGSLRDARAFYERMVAADLERCRYPLERVTVRVWRAGQALFAVKGPVAAALRKVVRVADLLWVNMAMNSELPTEVCPGPGIWLHHGGRSIVLHPSTRIGARVDVFHEVTVGVRDNRPAARIGDDVALSVGCRVLGPVEVAPGTVVGANAVLVKDTEPGGAYGGVPARKIGEAYHG